MSKPKVKSPSVTKLPEAAQAWRAARNMTRQQLAERTGYSVESIALFERGIARNGRTNEVVPIKQWVWRRYELACAGVEYEIQSGSAFTWK